MNVEELDRIIDSAKSVPLSESDSEKLKTALHALAERLLPRPKTEKISSVFDDLDNQAPKKENQRKDRPAGHGCNGADAYRGAPRKWRSLTRSWHTVIAVRTAAEAMSTHRKSRKRWYESWARHRWRLPSMNWKDYACHHPWTCRHIPSSRCDPQATAGVSTLHLLAR